MPGAERVESTPLGAAPRGGSPRAVWLTTDSDPGLLSARAAALRSRAEGRGAHLVWNPVTGETTQLMPATAAATGTLADGDTDHAEDGRVCVLILVVGRVLAPFTEGPLVGLTEILRWLDSWEIVRQWPTGTPGVADPPPRSPVRERNWARGGHFGHCQVPGARSDSPGQISPDRILNHPTSQTPPSPLGPPRPRAPESHGGGGHSRPALGEHDLTHSPPGVGPASLTAHPLIAEHR
ncbi:hypothetical protein [Halostreptopolyspora alba]|uniref:Uncharacterized protein n=1 Tax=Halostreptopolyspora alba TaxID=2487137 RepID=A0A3N0E6T8_9ACTN|nr:hypothetical protein EFW17_15880 [Nocardiopsaceae bacterium YIM 96095]